jgi:acyl carrier protein
MEDAIKQFIVDEMLFGKKAKADLAVDESLISAGIIDSITLYRLLSYLQEYFRITVDDEDVIPENFESIQALARYVRSKADLS